MGHLHTYNVIFAENENNYERIVLVSILPDYDTGEQWSEVDTLNEKFQEVSLTDLQSLFVSNVGYVNENMTNIERKYYNEYHVIVENNGKLYKSNNCLLELFDIKSVDPIIPSTYGQLNLKDSELKISEYLDFFSKYYPNYNPALSGYIDNSKKLNYREWWRFWRDYLSSILRINNDIGYKFWTTSFNNSNHNLDFSRGVERLIYIPGKGIVAGSYDFYFRPLFETNGDGDVFNNLFYKNMVEEKVALASELSF
ncbi:hypothetical protein M8998_07040 [Sphingobacterium sp. lm-10]|uniref:hypothetical protein n=1 Tax=Sphingobacterium sp. lm-10 TaxID=2944904 RepID=UPI0020221345|nr:hypothetical protein [Sphingobacterium sp. lm-10]MCL7987689.1 hypothetical protein [Sphingobacterium sp. lm-10]